MDINILKSHLNTIHNTANTTQKNLFEDVDIQEINETVLNYFEAYFGGNLNENTEIEEIEKSIIELNLVRDAVNDYFTEGINEEIQFDESIVFDFYESYFGDNVNESSTDKDLSEAIEHLNFTCDNVNEYMNVDEGFWSGLGKASALGVGGYLAYKNRDKLMKGAKFLGRKGAKYGKIAGRKALDHYGDKGKDFLNKTKSRVSDAYKSATQTGGMNTKLNNNQRRKRFKITRTTNSSKNSSTRPSSMGDLMLSRKTNINKNVPSGGKRKFVQNVANAVKK